jgi:cysteine-rich CPCC protein
VQLLDPWFRGGANTVSLAEAQLNFQKHGASEIRFKKHVRHALPSDVRDPRWRPVGEVDRAHVTTPAKLNLEQPDGNWRWYYWDK